MSHSPGPWKWENDVNAGDVLVDADGYQVIDECNVNEETMRLLQAAPEMFELLKELSQKAVPVARIRGLVARIEGK